MANSKSAGSYWAELKHTGLYKRNQGRLTRQVTAASLGLAIFLGAYTLSQGYLKNYIKSFSRVKVAYAGREIDQSLDQSLRQIGNQFSAVWGSDEFGLVTGREIEFLFPTSQFWETRSELRGRQEAQIQKFKDAVTNKHDSVALSGPDHILRDAPEIQLGVPFLICVIGGWMVFRLINFPRFSDFLISVEAEMDKVSWSSWSELIRATVVVISMLFVLGAVLFVFDVLWQYIFELIGFLQISA